jgi:Amt family ammonium transporter
MICAMAIGIKNKLGFDDALDVVGVHLVGGLWGTLSIGLFATSATTSYYGSSDDKTFKPVEGLFYGGDASQLGKQAVAAFAVMAFSFIGTLIIALVLKHTMGIRVSEEDEILGIDQAEHAETAYEWGSVSTGSSHTSVGAPAPQRVVT